MQDLVYQCAWHAPVWLPRWQSDDRHTRMVFIGHGIRESWVRELIELLDAEVANESSRFSDSERDMPSDQVRIKL